MAHLAMAGRVGMVLVAVAGAIWWFRLPGWSGFECPPPPAFCEGVPFDALLGPMLWSVTVAVSVVVLAAGRLLRPESRWPRLAWSVGMSGSIFVANLRSPVWAVVVTAVGVVLMTGSTIVRFIGRGHEHSAAA